MIETLRQTRGGRPPQPPHVTYFVVELLDTVARTRPRELNNTNKKAVGSIGSSGGDDAGLRDSSAAVVGNDSGSVDDDTVREAAVQMLTTLYCGACPGFDVDDDNNTLRIHILQRLRRLCMLPGEARLVEVAKQVT